MKPRRTPAAAARPAADLVAAADAPETATAPLGETATVTSPERAVIDGMVEVRQLSIDAGPDGVAHPGEIRMIPADDPMIEGGFVEPTGA